MPVKPYEYKGYTVRPVWPIKCSLDVLFPVIVEQNGKPVQYAKTLQAAEKWIDKKTKREEYGK